nr:MAG TPA: hypothetical protein [Bacteriophage sp.]
MDSPLIQKQRRNHLRWGCQKRQNTMHVNGFC